MELTNRSFLLKLHTVLAALTLPAALMFFITGFLYTWGFKGEYNISTYEIMVNEPIEADAKELKALALKELQKLKVEPPSGEAKIKKAGTSFKFEWTGSKVDIVIEPTIKPQVAKLQVKKASWYRELVQLHKAKGGTFFKIYATFFVLFFIIILTTGLIMAWQMPKLRKVVISSIIAGFCIFFLAVVGS